MKYICRLKEIIVAILFIIIFPFSGISTNYYISNEGKDSNSGKSLNEPWRTIEQVNKLKPVAGDSILFRRGDSWSGTITITSSGKEGAPIYFGAYGSGNKPRIYGSQEIQK